MAGVDTLQLKPSSLIFLYTLSQTYLPIQSPERLKLYFCAAELHTQERIFLNNCVYLFSDCNRLLIAFINELTLIQCDVRACCPRCTRTVNPQWTDSKTIRSCDLYVYGNCRSNKCENITSFSMLEATVLLCIVRPWEMAFV